MEIISKISAKTLVGDVKTAPDGELFRVVGNATGIETGESQFGQWEALVGDFLASSPDGKEFKAGKAFLPVTALNLLRGSLMEGNSVQFAFVIGKKKSSAAPVGYEYTITPMIETKEDPLKALMDQGNKALGTGSKAKK